MAKLAAHRYARALFMLAEEKNLLKEYMASATAMLKIFAESKELSIVFRHAHISSEEKMALLARVLKDAAPADFMGLFEIVIRKNREYEMESILEWFIVLAREALAITTATVESASPLTAAQTETLAQKLSRITGKTVELDISVKPELLAGFRVSVDGRVLDGTVRQKLDALQAQLMHMQLAKG